MNNQDTDFLHDQAKDERILDVSAQGRAFAQWEAADQAVFLAAMMEQMEKDNPDFPGTQIFHVGEHLGENRRGMLRYYVACMRED